MRDEGEVTLVKPDPSAYAEVARFKAVTGKCWNTPAISDGRLYVRSTTEAAAYEIAATVAPKLKPYLGTGLADGNGAFQLFISNQDGSTLTADRVSTIDILTSTDPALGWTKLTVTPELVHDQLRIEDSQSGSIPQRCFRTEEQP